MADGFRWGGPGRLAVCVGAESSVEEESTGAGDMGREAGGLGVDVPVGRGEEPCFFLCFLRLDSLPLASELLVELGRLRDVEEVVRWFGSRCLPGRLEGVLVPFVEAAGGIEDVGWPPLDLSFSACAVAFFSSSFFCSSSFSRSMSESEDSLCANNQYSLET